MPLDLPLRCRCGYLRGVAHDVSPSAGFRFICYCKDCQAFARYLVRSDALDAAGGTDIFQIAPARTKLTAGADALRSVSFSGRVLRWYAECCRTPVANTPARPGFPILALIHSFIDHDTVGRSGDEALGPPRCGIYGRSATGPLPANVPPPSFGLFANRTAKLLRWWVHGLGRPNPFFDDLTHAPLSAPRLLTPSERPEL